MYFPNPSLSYYPLTTSSHDFSLNPYHSLLKKPCPLDPSPGKSLPPTWQPVWSMSIKKASHLLWISWRWNPSFLLWQDRYYLPWFILQSYLWLLIPRLQLDKSSHTNPLGFPRTCLLGLSYHCEWVHWKAFHFPPKCYSFRTQAASPSRKSSERVTPPLLLHAP